MPKTVEHIHWPDAPDLWMPYAPAIKVRGGTTVYLAGVTAAPVYHHHPHRPEEFDAMPRDMAGQARAALENLKRGLDAVGASFADVVTAGRFVTDFGALPQVTDWSTQQRNDPRLAARWEATGEISRSPGRRGSDRGGSVPWLVS